ncbi:8112_t:CDS:2, partial [Racocetra fulgida]
MKKFCSTAIAIFTLHLSGELIEETFPFIANLNEKDTRNYKTYDIPSTVDSRPNISQANPLTRKISICLGILSLLALPVLLFYNFGDYDDVTRIPKRYQLCRDNYDIFDYTIESSFFASKNNELTMIQDVNSLTQNFTLNLNASSPNVTFSRMTYAMIKQFDRQLGEYQIQEFFYQNSVVYYDSPVTIPNNYQLLRDKLNINDYEIQSTSLISPYNDINNTSSTIRAIIKAIKYPSGKYSVREFFYETGVKNYPYTLITANSTIQDKWPAIVEIYFTSLGNYLDPFSLEVCNYRLAFFKEGYEEDIKGHIERRCPKASESNFYIVSKVEGNSNYDYNYVIESTVYPPFITSDIYESNMTSNNNSSSKQNDSLSLNDDKNSSTIRAIINAAHYESGYYEVQEFFYKPGSQDYYDSLITTKVILNSLLPGIVEVSFTTSDKVLDPYALEACEYKLIYFKNLEGQIKRRCKRAFEDDFYMVSQVSGSTYWGLKFTLGDDDSKLSASTSAVYYWPSR